MIPAEFEKSVKYINPILETQLELLHQCLTPDGLEKITWKEDGTIIIKIDENDKEGKKLPSKIESDQAKDKFNTLQKQKTDGPFGDQYIKALSELRNALLPD